MGCTRRRHAWDNGGMLIAPGIDADNEALADFCRRSGIRRLAVFGSALRDDFGPESDVDLLVEFEPGHTPGMMGVSRLQRELEALLGGGRSVDLRTYGDLSRYFRDEVRATARPVFDAAA
jgi:predicted nucleotidyltransferase